MNEVKIKLITAEDTEVLTKVFSAPTLWGEFVIKDQEG